MVNYIIGMMLLFCAWIAQAATTAERLDQLEQSRVLLTKEIEVANLQAQLNKAQGEVGIRPNSDVGSALSLIKITGLASKPEAVFLYGGYRIVADKGDMVIPNIQILSVNQSYVVLKDITSGKESILWLSADTSSSTTTTTPTPTQ
jgi:hypothetical protein